MSKARVVRDVAEDDHVQGNADAPITLIDGAKLVDLLIEHSLGVKKELITMLEIEHEAFAGDKEMLDEATESQQ